MNCHRRDFQLRLLEQGHRAFFDRIEGGGPDGWRLHFFCRDTAAGQHWYDVGVGAGVVLVECRWTCNAEQFAECIGSVNWSVLGSPGQLVIWMVGLGTQAWAIVTQRRVSTVPSCIP